MSQPQEIDAAIGRILANEKDGACYWDSSEPEDGPDDAAKVAKGMLVALECLKAAMADFGFCPICKMPSYHDHEPDCKLSALLGEVE
jgi:hypothetical protein